MRRSRLWTVGTRPSVGASGSRHQGRGQGDTHTRVHQVARRHSADSSAFVSIHKNIVECATDIPTTERTVTVLAPCPELRVRLSGASCPNFRDTPRVPRVGFEPTLDGF